MVDRVRPLQLALDSMHAEEVLCGLAHTLAALVFLHDTAHRCLNAMCVYVTHLFTDATTTYHHRQSSSAHKANGNWVRSNVHAHSTIRVIG
jgi:hypothetical protein